VGRHPETTAERASTGGLSVAEILASGMREPIGDPPEDFDEMEVECWNRYSIEMERFGFADRSHRMSLELLCRTYAEWRGHLRSISEEGNKISVEGTRGPAEVINPAIKAAKDCRANINTFLGELLLTPKAQAKTKPPKVQNENEGPTWEGT
jgi:P27 family predicted phage terminase small subunit